MSFIVQQITLIYLPNVMSKPREFSRILKLSVTNPRCYLYCECKWIWCCFVCIQAFYRRPQAVNPLSNHRQRSPILIQFNSFHSECIRPELEWMRIINMRLASVNIRSYNIRSPMRVLLQAQHRCSRWTRWRWRTMRSVSDSLMILRLFLVSYSICISLANPFDNISGFTEIRMTLWRRFSGQPNWQYRHKVQSLSSWSWCMDCSWSCTKWWGKGSTKHRRSTPMSRRPAPCHRRRLTTRFRSATIRKSLALMRTDNTVVTSSSLSSTPWSSELCVSSASPETCFQWWYCNGTGTTVSRSSCSSLSPSPILLCSSSHSLFYRSSTDYFRLSVITTRSLMHHQSSCRSAFQQDESHIYIISIS